MKFSNTLTILFIFINFFLIIACQSNTNQKNKVDTASNSISGEAVFKRYCVTCHGADGELGLNGAAKLTQSSLSREETISVIKNGRNMMQPYGNILSDKEVGAVTDYIFTFRR